MRPSSGDDPLAGQQLRDRAERPLYVKVSDLGAGSFGLVQLAINRYASRRPPAFLRRSVLRFALNGKCLGAWYRRQAPDRLRFGNHHLSLCNSPLTMLCRNTGEQVAIKLLERGPDKITVNVERELRSHISFCRAAHSLTHLTVQAKARLDFLRT